MNLQKIEKYLIETDILIDHLITNEDQVSDLEIAMSKGVCFTSVINAAELYLLNSDKEKKVYVDDLLKSIKVLGLHARYSLSISELNNNSLKLRDALFYVLAKTNKLPILTNKTKDYNINGVTIINPKELRG